VTTGVDPSDAVLARRAAKGDAQAFAVIVRRHKAPLYRLLRRYTGDADDAYEAAHEAFIAAWSAISRYDPARPFAAWLRTIAINKARDRRRRAAFRRLFFGWTSIEDTPEALARPDPGLPPDDAVAERQALETLDRAIADLPFALKDALVLTVFEGLTQAEAARALGVSAKAVETRVYRARKLLAANLSPELRPLR
jgi:RNA polymerase sigma factor (sigma-70 family)